MKKSTWLFIASGAAVILAIVVQSIGFASASTEAELAAVGMGNFFWIFGGAIVLAIAGFIMRKKEA